MSTNASAGGAALARCAARGAVEFAEAYWGRAPLLSRCGELGAAGFTDLLDADAVDELVSRRGLRTPFLRMAKDGEVLAARQFTRGGGAGAGVADQAADDKVLARLADGASLVLQGLHRTWPPLVDFGARLAHELGHPVQINAYVTPPQSRGFAPHYDVHDVFVLQVRGRKHWRIHAPVIPAPLDDQPWEDAREAVTTQAAGEPLIDCVLGPGDALYLPRGTIHAAEALGETSIHITVGVQPVTRYQLVRHLLELAQQDEALRASLPMGIDLGDPDVLSVHLAQTVEALRRHLDDVAVDAVARRVGDRLITQTRPEPLGPLAQLASAEALAPDSRLRLRGALRWRLADDGDRLGLVLVDRTVSVPAQAAAALKTVLAGEPFTLEQLPGLDAEGRIVLARRLLREGVIVPA